MSLGGEVLLTGGAYLMTFAVRGGTTIVSDATLQPFAAHPYEYRVAFHCGLFVQCTIAMTDESPIATALPQLDASGIVPRQMSEVRYDDDGMVRGFPYHDGSLDGVLLNGTEVHLALRSVNGERRVLTLQDVTRLSLDGFREGNTVLNIWLHSIADAVCRPSVRKTVAEKLFVDVKDVKDAECSVFLLESSYGADVAALCGKVEISESCRGLEVR